MALYESRGQLGKMMKDLLVRWHETKMNWDDARAHQFEERFIVPLEKDLRQAISAMDQMGTLISSIKNDCS
jgi:hypothetical protein